MSEHRTALIVNPVAGRNRAARHVARAIRRSWPGVRIALTQRPGHAHELAACAIDEGVSLIVACGGDGTVHEVANAILERGAPVALGVIPAGSGTDFSRTLGLPHDCTLGHLMVEAECRPIDALRVTRRSPGGDSTVEYCINVGDVGLGAETGAIVNRNRGDRKPGRFLRAALAAIRAHRPLELRVTVDGEVLHEGLANLAVAANGRYFGGGMHMAPMARIDDGSLEALVLHATPKPVLALRLLPAVYLGAHMGHPNIRHRRGATMTITAAGPALLELDGEVRTVAEVTFEVLPRALTLVIPGQ